MWRRCAQGSPERADGPGASLLNLASAVFVLSGGQSLLLPALRRAWPKRRCYRAHRTGGQDSSLAARRVRHAAGLQRSPLAARLVSGALRCRLSPHGPCSSSVHRPSPFSLRCAALLMPTYVDAPQRREPARGAARAVARLRHPPRFWYPLLGSSGWPWWWAMWYLAWLTFRDVRFLRSELKRRMERKGNAMRLVMVIAGQPDGK